MKNLLIILFLFLSVNNAFSTGQRPDYLIMGTDTIPIFSNPLRQYLEKNDFDFFQEIIEPYSIINNSDGTTTEYIIGTNCWRGYVAYWRIENDSLKLNSINACCTCVPMTSDQIIFKIFENSNVFANWYNGIMTAPNGDLFSGGDMGYNAIYEYEDKLQVENGIIKSKWQISNIELIEQIKLDNKLYSQIPVLKDTLLFYLSKNLDWEKLDNSNCDCWDSYILSYDISGQIIDVEYIKYQDDSTTIRDKLYDWRFDKKCSKKIQSAIEPLTLSYLDSHREFKIEIQLFYGDHLKMWKCRHYFKPISDKEIEEYVRSQMDLKE